MRWGLLGVLVVALTSAGCGGSGTLSVDPVASAADRTLDKQTGRFDLAVTVAVPLLGRSTITGHGTFSAPEQAFAMTMELPFGSATGSSMDIRLIYPVMYIRPAAAPLPASKSWVKVDLQQALKTLGVNLPQLQLSGSQSPTDALAQLRGSKDAKKLGTETIDGVKATHYRVKINLDRALARATAFERKAVQRLLRMAKRQGVDAVPTHVDVWVGDDGLVRRLTEKIGNVGTVKMTFSGHGEPVQIEAPPADETVSLTNLLTQSG